MMDEIVFWSIVIPMMVTLALVLIARQNRRH